MALHIVTGNTKKYAELSDALSRHGIETVRTEADIDELQENDPRVIIADKVKKAFDIVGGPVLVDDSGFYIEKYHSFPGPLSKHVFAGIGYDGMFRLASEGDSAYFHAFVAYMDSNIASGSGELQIFDAQYSGVITEDFQSEEGNEMPYAPMFIPHDADGKRMSQMTMDERAHDHRHLAIEKFAQWYTNASVQ